MQVSFSLADHQEPVLELMDKYADVPMSLADACLVRMTEVLPEPVVLTTDTDFAPIAATAGKSFRASRPHERGRRWRRGAHVGQRQT